MKNKNGTTENLIEYHENGEMAYEYVANVGEAYSYEYVYDDRGIELTYQNSDGASRGFDIPKPTIEPMKKQTSIKWLANALLICEPNLMEWNKLTEQAIAMQEEEMETTYADGYTQGYDRALELMQWKIDNELKQHHEK